MNLPPHKCGLYLEHNTHRGIYESIEQAVAQLDKDKCEWANPGEREAALATGELWTLQWYPNTPIGFYKLAAASLESLLEAAKYAK